jgi:diaminopimelate decarboxylase
LRLVPEIETDTLHGLQTALLTSKFGMMPDEALAAFRRWSPGDVNLNLCGIHLHIGSQNPKATPYAEALKTLFENLLLIFNETGHRLAHLNLGGGFPVNYLRDESSTEHFTTEQRDFFRRGIRTRTSFARRLANYGYNGERSESRTSAEKYRIANRTGRSIIADAGVCLTTVKNKKKDRCRTPNAECGLRNRIHPTPKSEVGSPKFRTTSGC